MNIIREFTDGVSGAFLIGANIIFNPLLRKWRRTWGASAAETSRPLPGDELVPQPKWQYTHAVTIQALVNKVWPWLVQLGQGRGGWYSYTLLENIAGCKIKNAERILPEFQELIVGDGIHMHPKAPAMPVAELQPGRVLVLGGMPTPDKDGKYFGSTQALYLEAQPGGVTRFIVRGRSDYSKDAAVWAGPGMMEPISAMMNRKMMLTIKERAERRAN